MRLLLLATFCVLPAFGILLYEAWRSGEQRIEQANLELRARAQAAARDMDSEIQAAAASLRDLARATAIRDPVSGGCAGMSRGLATRAAAFSSGGHIVCGISPLSTQATIADRSYFVRAAESGRAVVGDPVVTDRERDALPIARAARDGGGVHSVWVIGIDLRRFAERHVQAGLDSSASLTLWNREGSAVFAWPPAAGESGIPGHPPPDGARFIYGNATVSGLGDAPFKVGLGTPAAPLLAASRAEFRRDLLLLASVIVVTFVVAWLMGEVLIRRRIAALIEATERMKGGDLSVRTGASLGGDELVALGRSFDTMAHALEQREEALRRTNAELEQRVEERTRELTSANKDLEAYSYSVSHDLRAPLRAIAGFTSILREDHATRLPEEGARLLERVDANARRMGALIDDLLKFSRLNQHPIVRLPLDLQEIAQACMRDFDEDIARHGVEFELGPLPAVSGDPTLVAQVLHNLIGNAIKYTRLRERPHVAIHGEISGEEAIIQVRDNGVGFDMAFAGKLFEVFHRLHSTAEYEGSGVGLAIARRIVVRHGGRIWAESAPGEGATFRFSLPLGP